LLLAPVEAVAAAIRGGEDGAPDARPVEAARPPAAASLIATETAAPVTVVVSGAGILSPPAVVVGESWGLAPIGASWAPLALDPATLATGALNNKSSNQIQYK
jgi:hypothetical protein